MTANPKPSAEAERRAAIKRRRGTSAFWMAVHLLGSLNVAVILLVTIAGMIAFATIMESKFDTAVARCYIYDNPLFTLWLVVLALNLTCAAFTRWPWQKKHIGFVVTHAGIILLLPSCGSASTSANTPGGTQAGTYIITITGSAGTGASHALQLFGRQMPYSAGMRRGGLGQGDGGGRALVFKVAPAKILAFAKGAFSQTRYSFS